MSMDVQYIFLIYKYTGFFFFLYFGKYVAYIMDSFPSNNGIIFAPRDTKPGNQLGRRRRLKMSIFYYHTEKPLDPVTDDRLIGKLEILEVTKCAPLPFLHAFIPCMHGRVIILPF